MILVFLNRLFHHTQSVLSGSHIALATLVCSIFLPSVVVASSPDTPITIPNSNALSPVRFEIQQSDIPDGFDVAIGNDEFRVRARKHALSERDRIYVRMKRIKKKDLSIGDEKILSRAFVYDVYHRETVTLSRPLELAIRWKQDTKQDYVVKYWDSTTQQWRDAPEQTVDRDARIVSAKMTFPYSIVAVFKKKKETIITTPEPIEFSGKASWYDWYGAAMNTLPYGSTVEVKNTATGDTATTTIVSTGPYISGRIIDLPRDVFSQLAPLSQGVITVLVTVLHIPSL